MDPIAIDVPKVSSFGKPVAPVKSEPAKPPFPPAAPAPEVGPNSLTGKIAAALGLRKNGKILAAAGCSLLIGYAAVKYLAPKPQPETSQPLVADAKGSKEEPKPEVKPSTPATTSIQEQREPAAPAAPSGFVIPLTSPVPPLSPSSAVVLPTIPTTPPSVAIPPTLPPGVPETFVPVPAGTSKAIPPIIPEIAPPSFAPVVPVSGVEAPKVPTAPPVVPSTPIVPVVPAVIPSLPELPGVPPSSPSVPLPMVPSMIPPSIAPPSITPPSSVIPPAVLPTMPEPSKPLTIEYTKPAFTPDVKPVTMPDRAASTTFDVDLYEPTKVDTYGTICREFYNDAKYAAALAEYNGRRALQGGVRVEVPPIHVLKKRYPQLLGAVMPASLSAPAKDPWQPSGESTPAFRPTGARTFTVPTGGLRMAEVARETLGSPTRWRDIYDINPQLSPGDLLSAGTVVKIPTELK